MKYSIKLLALLVSASFCLQASAAIITVMNTNDSGDGSLRQALADANDGDTIDFDSSLNGGTITLTSGQLLINKNLTITGPGANLLAISGSAASRVFFVNPGKTVTIDGLTIMNGNAGGDAGGGIYNDHGTLTVTNSTLSGNSASFGNGGGGIFNDGVSGSATLEIGDTILNAGASGENITNNSGTITSLGYNLSSDDASAFLNAPGDQNIIDPMLGPLQDNGGPTFTHALLAGSPAINAGDPNFTPPPFYDQRGPGFDRVVNGRIDIGAFEVQPRCPQPQGFWKSNPALWPVTSLELGSQTYSQTELLTILNTAVRADASLILADQSIAAKLNIANGSDPAPVSSTIPDADSLLSGFSDKLPYNVRPSSPTGQMMVNDANTLSSYNNGLLTPVCTP